MKVLNLGSLNLDKVYSVKHFVSPGETLACCGYDTSCGGKGLNQSVALARAGVEVYHAGAVGKDGQALCDLLKNAGADTRYLVVSNSVSGHAVIQLTPDGQNCIIIHGGANQTLDEAYIDHVLEAFDQNDLLLVQNETSGVGYAVRRAVEKKMRVVLNPSPITDALYQYPLEQVDYLILNEIEGAALSGREDEAELEILKNLCNAFPRAAIVLTVGKGGAYYQKGNESYYNDIYPVEVADTTAAGDTFCGYFIAGLAKGFSPQRALETASLASSIAVSRKGAAASIPTWSEVERFGAVVAGKTF